MKKNKFKRGDIVNIEYEGGILLGKIITFPKEIKDKRNNFKLSKVKLLKDCSKHNLLKENTYFFYPYRFRLNVIEMIQQGAKNAKKCK